jgi:YVTN family beta-propeller protein
LQLPGFGYSPARVASGSGWAWLGSGGRVARIDLLTQSLAGTIKLPLLHDDEVHGDVFLTDIAVGAGAVWVSGDVLNPTLWRIDAATSRVTDAIALPFAPDAVAAGVGAVWVANQLDDSVTRIDQRTRQVGVTIKVGREPVGITVGIGSVWVANALDGSVSRIDPATTRVVATIAVGGDVEDVIAAPDGVWVAIRRA